MFGNWISGLTPAVLEKLTLRQLLNVYEFIEENSVTKTSSG